MKSQKKQRLGKLHVHTNYPGSSKRAPMMLGQHAPLSKIAKTPHYHPDYPGVGCKTDQTIQYYRSLQQISDRVAEGSIESCPSEAEQPRSIKSNTSSRTCNCGAWRLGIQRRAVCSCQPQRLPKPQMLSTLNGPHVKGSPPAATFPGAVAHSDAAALHNLGAALHIQMGGWNKEARFQDAVDGFERAVALRRIERTEFARMRAVSRMDRRQATKLARRPQHGQRLPMVSSTQPSGNKSARRQQRRCSNGPWKHASSEKAGCSTYFTGAAQCGLL